MDNRYKYTMLLTSLPAHQVDLFLTEQNPVSRIQLNKRLALLDENDKTDLERIEALLHWSQQLEKLDEEIIKQAQQLIALIENPFLQQSVLWRLELRTIMAALRKRQQGHDCPEKNTLGFGKWTFFIHKNWQELDFGIGQQLPWLLKAQQYLVDNQPLKLEKLLLELVWTHYAQSGSLHYFDFEAVVIYVLRWNVINRWVSYDEEKALLRFDGLVNSSLKLFYSNTQVIV